METSEPVVTYMYRNLEGTKRRNETQLKVNYDGAFCSINVGIYENLGI